MVAEQGGSLGAICGSHGCRGRETRWGPNGIRYQRSNWIAVLVDSTLRCRSGPKRNVIAAALDQYAVISTVPEWEIRVTDNRSCGWDRKVAPGRGENEVDVARVRVIPKEEESDSSLT